MAWRKCSGSPLPPRSKCGMLFTLILAVIDFLAILRFDLQTFVGLLAKFLPVGVAVFHTIDPFIEIFLSELFRLADLIPCKIELVIAVVIALGIRWMTRERNVTHRADHNARDHRAVRVGPNDGFFDDLFRGEDDLFCGKGGLIFLEPSDLLGAEQSAEVAEKDEYLGFAGPKRG